MSAGPNKILILDDDARVAKLLKRYLERESYEVELGGSVAEAREIMGRWTPDLLILDLMLPDGNGLALARELKAERELAIIILSGKQDVIDRIVGLEVGADDYITKPFDERELLARVRSVLRRVQAAPVARESEPPDEELLGFEGWVCDTRTHELFDPDGKPVVLTSYEFQLLVTFVTRPNRVLSRDEILESVAGRRWNPFDRSIDVLVGKLRKKLEADVTRPALVKTIRGSGYKFTGVVEHLSRHPQQLASGTR